MAALDIDRLITALSTRIGQDFTLRSGVTINIASIRRSGAGDALVIFGTITKAGVGYVPAGGWPIIWTNARGGVNGAEAAENARAMLDALVT